MAFAVSGVSCTAHSFSWKCGSISSGQDDREPASPDIAVFDRCADPRFKQGPFETSVGSMMYA